MFGKTILDHPHPPANCLEKITEPKSAPIRDGKRGNATGTVSGENVADDVTVDVGQPAVDSVMTDG